MIRTDSRKVQKGDTFVALDGISSNGCDYINDAVDRGAKYIVCKPDQFEHFELAKAGKLRNVIQNGRPKFQDALRMMEDDRVTVIYTLHPRQYMEKSLRTLYNDMIDDMTIIGLTGTNGKTTTAYLINQAFNQAGIQCAYIGTIGFYIGTEKIMSLPNTSVDICSLYELLIYAYERGVKHVAIEASSQGLDLFRLNTIRFDAAVFTNLTEDHLDYHKTMEAYAKAKLRLFKMIKEDGVAIVNSDDPSAATFMLEDNKNITYGMNSGENRILKTPKDDPENRVFSYEINGEVHTTSTQLVGSYNMYNLMACVSVLSSLGVSGEKIDEIVPQLIAPEGRCEVIEYGTNKIIIDYAHTPDAMENIIGSARNMTQGHIYSVFGCTGDREREKRPVMTQIGLSNCDYAILTTDDPHCEDQEQIFNDMIEGNTLENYEICADRAEAIRKGIALLKDGDILLILGKGHEKFMIVGTEKVPFNDKETVLKIIEQ